MQVFYLLTSEKKEVFQTKISAGGQIKVKLTLSQNITHIVDPFHHSVGF